MPIHHYHYLGNAGFRDGSSDAALFNHPQGLAVDGDGNILLADLDNHKASSLPSTCVYCCAITRSATDVIHSGRKLPFMQHMYTIMGRRWATMLHAYASGCAPLAYTCRLYLTGDGSLAIQVRMVCPSGMTTTIAGSGRPGGLDAEVGAQATFAGPVAVAVTGSGELLVTEQTGIHLRRIRTRLSPPCGLTAGPRQALSTFNFDMLALLASDEHADVTFVFPNASAACAAGGGGGGDGSSDGNAADGYAVLSSSLAPPPPRLTAHRIILAARCELFRKMLSSDMVEGRTRVVEVTDTSVNGLRAFLKYVQYTPPDEFACLSDLLCRRNFQRNMNGSKFEINGWLNATVLTFPCPRSSPAITSASASLHLLMLRLHLRPIFVHHSSYAGTFTQTLSTAAAASARSAAVVTAAVLVVATCFQQAAAEVEAAAPA